MASLRRKPRTPFEYVLKSDPGAVFVIRPPSNRVWGEIMDATLGNQSALIECVIRCVVELKAPHPDAAAFGTADSDARREYVDGMDILIVRELGNAVAGTLLTADELGNSDSPSA